jgi:putative endonuclease
MPRPQAAQLGAQGERLAAELLRSRGYHILGQNLRGRLAEVDILCRHDHDLIVVEVKSRSSRFADPIESIGPRKLRCLRRACRALAAKFPGYNIRLDAVTVYWEPGSAPILTHYSNLI